MADRRLAPPTSPGDSLRPRCLGVVATPQHVATDVRGDTVLLHLPTRAFHGLEAVGTRVWQLLGRPIEVAALRDAIVREYEVTSARYEADLFELAADLEAAGLIEVLDEGPAEARRPRLDRPPAADPGCVADGHGGGRWR